MLGRGGKLKKRRPSFDSWDETDIRRAIGDSAYVCSVSTEGIDGIVGQKKALLAARLALAVLIKDVMLERRWATELFTGVGAVHGIVNAFKVDQAVDPPGIAAVVSDRPDYLFQLLTHRSEAQDGALSGSESNPIFSWPDELTIPQRSLELLGICNAPDMAFKFLTQWCARVTLASPAVV